MSINLKTAIAISVAALMLSACVSQSSYDDLKLQNEQLQTQNQQLQAQIAGLQNEARFVEAGDMLFPSGGYQLSQAGKTELSTNVVPKLTGLHDAKVVVYGYTDNVPVGAQLQQQGIADNLTLSTRRAVEVANYLISQGVDRNIVSAKGFGETHPVASNDTTEGQAQNRRIVITVQGPGAPSS